MKTTQHSFRDLAISDIQTFCNVADAESYTAVAHMAGVSPAAISKTVMRIEKRLATQLVIRTTRQMRLTDAGVTFAERCRQALRLLSEAEQEATGAQVEPSGRLRFSLPTPYAHWRVLPLIGEFRALYPKISLEIHISNRRVAFPVEDFDLVIRGREIEDSGLIARKLEDAELVIVASPRYLASMPAVHAIDDLNNHQCIRFIFPTTGRSAPWLYRENNEIKEFEPTGSVFVEEEFLGGISLAAGGAGVYQIYRFAVEQELKNGSLVEVLQGYGGATLPFYLMYMREARNAPRVKAFSDFLIKKLRIRK